MSKLQQHEIRLEQTHPSGAEEWFCPTCGRRLILYLPPGCETLALERGNKHVLVWGSKIGTMVAIKIVLNPGDEYTIHSGNISRPSFPEVAQVDQVSLSKMPNPWIELLDDVDFGDWNDGDQDSLSQTGLG